MKKYVFLFGLCIWMVSISAQDSLNMRVLFHWEDPTIPPAFFIENPYNEVWGWYDPVKEREYAIIGSSIGTHFFDITDINNASEVAFVPGEPDMIHRDFKNKDQYLFMVADEHESNLTVVDMSYLPDSVSVVYDSDSLFNNSHNIWIDGDHMYVCIPRFTNPVNFVGGIAIYDISNPATPTLIGAYNQYDWIHDVYSRNDTAYLHSETRGMYIVDFTDPQNPVTLGSMVSYPFQGYNHSGWLSDDGLTYAFIDETHGTPVKLLNVSDFSNLTITNYLLPGMNIANIEPNSIGHNPLMLGNYVFVSYYYDGVRVFDITDQLAPLEVGYYDTYLEPNSGFYHGNWGVYPYLPSGHILASDMQSGLYVLEFAPFVNTDLEQPLQVGISVYPNPASERIHIRYEGEGRAETLDLSLIDAMGRQVASDQLLSRAEVMEWNIPDGISSGVYVLQLRGSDGLLSQKIRIE